MGEHLRRLRRMRAGLPDRRADGARWSTRTGGTRAPPARPQVDSVCPYCGVGCQITYHIRTSAIVAVEGRDGPANQNRLCVKGRFGFDYVNHPHRLLTKPLIRRDDAPKRADCEVDPATPGPTSARRAGRRRWIGPPAGLSAHPRSRRRPGAGRLRLGQGLNEEAYLFQKLVRTGFGTNNVDHCTRLCHASSVAALMEGIGSGAVTAPFMRARMPTSSS
jgi:formate dehydrogenase major subunit